MHTDDPNNRTVDAADRRSAILLGYIGMGGIDRLTMLLRSYGYEEITALVDDPDTFILSSQYPSFRFAKLQSPTDADKLAQQVQSLGITDDTPYLCIQDRLTFSYLDSLQSLGRTQESRYWVPTEPIRRARIKPLCRLHWNARGLDDTRWTVLDRSGNVRTDLPNRSPLEIDGSAAYVVKPVCGMGSEGVSKVKSFAEALAQGEKIREYYKREHLPDTFVEVDGFKFDIYGDILVEELLRGEEYTVDGFVRKSRVFCVVQHKESRIEYPFLGDGLIVSPPDLRDNPAFIPQSQFDEFVSSGLSALGLDDWVFHAELIATNKGLRFVELNPRPAGGLLSFTAGQHLGMDSFEHLLRAYLRIDSVAVARDWVTGQFPVYAFDEGVFEEMQGLDQANAIPGVVARLAVKPPHEIDSLDRENYLAYVSVHAPSHAAVRKLANHVRSILKPVIRKRSWSSSAGHFR